MRRIRHLFSTLKSIQEEGKLVLFLKNNLNPSFGAETFMQILYIILYAFIMQLTCKLDDLSSVPCSFFVNMHRNHIYHFYALLHVQEEMIDAVYGLFVSVLFVKWRYNTTESLNRPFRRGRFVPHFRPRGDSLEYSSFQIFK